MGHIFISYSHKDKAYVEKLEKKLIDEGFDVWIDKSIRFSDSFPTAISNAIDACDAFIVVVSENSSESEWVEREIIHAGKSRKPIFPLLFKGKISNKIHFLLGHIQYLDVSNGSLPPEEFYEDLARETPRQQKDDPVTPPPGSGDKISWWERIKIKPKKIAFWGGGLALLVAIIYSLQFLIATGDGVVSTPTEDYQTGDTWRRPADNWLMSYIPSGEFLMGSEDGYEDERPVHRVYIDAFWIDQTEITNAMYMQCMESGTCVSQVNDIYIGNAEYANHPVVYVSWNEASSYCEWAGARLPTESEWERAARGNLEGGTYPWGEGISCEKASYNGNSGCIEGNTTAVRSYENGRNPYGLYDMAGNVLEWTADWYSEEFYNNSPSSNPLGPNTGEKRVLRGGSWKNLGNSLRIAYRVSFAPDGENYT